jgi:LysM repeat protein
MGTKLESSKPVRASASEAAVKAAPGKAEAAEGAKAGASGGTEAVEAARAPAGGVLEAESRYARAGQPAAAGSEAARTSGTKRLAKDDFQKKAQEARSHKLRRGETLTKVARQHGVTLAELREANPQISRQDESRLPVGAEIRLPGGAAGAEADVRRGAAGPAGKAAAAHETRAPADGRAYTPRELDRLTGRPDSYTPLDDWVNVTARREGTFTDAKDVGDGAGLSAGIKQWQQRAGTLGKLMQTYRDVAAREGKLDDFHRTFGGKENAEQLLQMLNNKSEATRMSVDPASIAPMFAEAAKLDVFKLAQIEQARAETRQSMQAVLSHHPYAKDGAVSAQSMAQSLAIHNIGPRLLGKTYRTTIDAVFEELKSKNPEIGKRFASQEATADQKREVVAANVSEREFNEKLVSVAPKVLYNAANYEKFHKGLEIRLRKNLDSFPPDQTVRLG